MPDAINSCTFDSFAADSLEITEDRAIRVPDQSITVPYVQKEQRHVHPYIGRGMPD